jgi:hypothetical protein
MTCTCRRCRILLPERVPLSELTSILVFRSMITASQLDRVRQKLLNANRFEGYLAELRKDPLAACMRAALVPLYVLQPSCGHAYRFRPEIIRHPCDCWDMPDAYLDGLFVIKSARMPHNSLELLCNGGDVLVRAAEARKALGLGPMPDKDLSVLVQNLIREAEAASVILTKAGIRSEVLKVGGVTLNRIDEMFGKYKPASWSVPGPRTKGKKS